MPNNRWEPKARAVKDVKTVTIGGTYLTDDTISITINQKSMVVTLLAGLSNPGIATIIQQAWERLPFSAAQASVVPAGGKEDIAEFGELTATVSGAIVTLTADKGGVPQTVSVSKVSASGTVTLASPTVATGPNFYDDTENWSLATLPAAGEDIFVDNTAVSIQYGMDASAVALASFTQAQNFLGDIGLPELNANGYLEHRPTYLQIDAATILLGNGPGTGSRRIKIDSGSTTANAVTVENTGAPAKQGLPAVFWKGTNAGNTLEVHRGQVGIAVLGGETATLTSALLAGGNVEFGKGVGTIATLTNQIATVMLRSTVTAFTSAGGLVTILGDAAFTTMDITGGAVDYRSSGTIGALTVGGPGGTLDCANDNSTRIISAATIEGGGRINDPLQTIDFTTGVQPGPTARALTAE